LLKSLKLDFYGQETLKREREEERHRMLAQSGMPPRK